MTPTLCAWLDGSMSTRQVRPLPTEQQEREVIREILLCFHSGLAGGGPAGIVASGVIQFVEVSVSPLFRGRHGIGMIGHPVAVRRASQAQLVLVCVSRQQAVVSADVSLAECAARAGVGFCSDERFTNAR